jgi:hypothetical protein
VCVDVCLGVSHARLDGVSSATPRKDTHDARDVTGDELVRGLSRLRWASGAIEDVDGVIDGIVPKANGCAASVNGRAGELHDCADGSFGDAVESVHVGRTSGGGDETFVEKFRKLARGKLTRVVGVQGTDDGGRLGLFAVEEGGEASHEFANTSGSLRLTLEEVHGFKTGVIVDEHE